MYFLGTSFFSYKNSMDATPIHTGDLTVINIRNAIFDDVFVSSNIDANTDILVWDFDTTFYAPFSGNLSAGNVAEQLSEITSILIKRRAVGANTWIPIFETSISSEEDLKFAIFDRFVANDQKYQYAAVFLLNDEEGSYNINEITPEFEGLFIVDENIIFDSVLEARVSTQRNHKKGIVEPIDQEFPFVIGQSRTNYDSGTAEGVFVQFSEDTCDFDFDSAYKYRRGLEQWLANGSRKVLKLDDGRIWMIMVTSPIRADQEIDTGKVTTSFDWVEIGNMENPKDLAENGFIDPRRI